MLPGWITVVTSIQPSPVVGPGTPCPAFVGERPTSVPHGAVVDRVPVMTDLSRPAGFFALSSQYWCGVLSRVPKNIAAWLPAAVSLRNHTETVSVVCPSTSPAGSST